MSIKPTFFFLDAQKSGSSWLARQLCQHHDIYLPSREIHYFDKTYNLSLGLDWYLDHFKHAASCQAIGEKTPEYLWANGAGAEDHNPNVHHALTATFPEARYIVVLRNPVDRGISALVHMIRTRRLPFAWPIAKLFSPEHADALKPWGILEKGLYARQLSAYLELIQEERLKVLVFEQDVKASPNKTLRSLCNFLGVDDSFEFTNLRSKANASPTTRRSPTPAAGRGGGRLAQRILLLFPDYPVSVSSSTRARLHEFYADENRQLYKLLGRTIPEWEFCQASFS
jgi:hypothetical protein